MANATKGDDKHIDVVKVKAATAANTSSSFSSSSSRTSSSSISWGSQETARTANTSPNSLDDEIYNLMRMVKPQDKQQHQQQQPNGTIKDQQHHGENVIVANIHYTNGNIKVFAFDATRIDDDDDKEEEDGSRNCHRNRMIISKPSSSSTTSTMTTMTRATNATATPPIATNMAPVATAKLHQPSKTHHNVCCLCCNELQTLIMECIFPNIDDAAENYPRVRRADEDDCDDNHPHFDMENGTIDAADSLCDAIQSIPCVDMCCDDDDDDDDNVNYGCCSKINRCIVYDDDEDAIHEKRKRWRYAMMKKRLAAQVLLQQQQNEQPSSRDFFNATWCGGSATTTKDDTDSAIAAAVAVASTTTFTSPPDDAATGCGIDQFVAVTCGGCGCGCGYGGVSDNMESSCMNTTTLANDDALVDLSLVVEHNDDKNDADDKVEKDIQPTTANVQVVPPKEETTSLLKLLSPPPLHPAAPAVSSNANDPLSSSSSSSLSVSSLQQEHRPECIPPSSLQQQIRSDDKHSFVLLKNDVIVHVAEQVGAALECCHDTSSSGNVKEIVEDNDDNALKQSTERSTGAKPEEEENEEIGIPNAKDDVPDLSVVDNSQSFQESDEARKQESMISGNDELNCRSITCRAQDVEKETAANDDALMMKGSVVGEEETKNIITSISAPPKNSNHCPPSSSSLKLRRQKMYRKIAEQARNRYSRHACLPPVTVDGETQPIVTNTKTS